MIQLFTYTIQQGGLDLDEVLIKEKEVFDDGEVGADKLDGEGTCEAGTIPEALLLEACHQLAERLDSDL